MKASIIIPTINRFELIIETVMYILDQDYEDFEVIVADQNKNWPNEFEYLRKKILDDSRVLWINIPTLGVVGARQQASAISSGKVLIFIDDDVIIKDDGFVAKHMRNYKDENIAAVCGREVVSRSADIHALAQGPEYPIEVDGIPPAVQPLTFPRNSKVRQEVCTFCTCNSSVRRENFMEIGGFDENFQGASYGDDYDFVIRLHDSGKKIIFDPSPELIHLQAKAGGLRLSVQSSRFSEHDKALSGWIFLLRHGQRGWRLYLLWNWVLRRTVFLKWNLVHFWRIPIAVFGLGKAYFSARKAVRAGPRSRFSGRR
ncbi:glycosyltransferase family 2 protein [Limibaculum sp. M0105]|uniref:Glycosyltransferase family 2 protein n=1 Tax=Thermohalobaculum xanthum TaxID=2753746 RepID=A0A8J7M8K0_9RHOB|nr:glycosyltransferase [Thermohalobaculum xanthum]MBK0399750.1 glycosyltransferase family 2 protein [Thermohalobaculum xanthum]